MNDYNAIVKTLELVRVFSGCIDMKACYEAFNEELEAPPADEEQLPKAA